MIAPVLLFCIVIWALAIWCYIETELLKKRAKTQYNERNN